MARYPNCNRTTAPASATATATTLARCGARVPILWYTAVITEWASTRVAASLDLAAMEACGQASPDWAPMVEKALQLSTCSGACALQSSSSTLLPRGTRSSAPRAAGLARLGLLWLLAFGFWLGFRATTPSIASDLRDPLSYPALPHPHVQHPHPTFPGRNHRPN